MVHPNHTEDSLQQKEMMNKMVYHSKCCYLEWTPPIQRVYLISYPTANSSLEGWDLYFNANITSLLGCKHKSCLTDLQDIENKVKHLELSRYLCFNGPDFLLRRGSCWIMRSSIFPAFENLDGSCSQANGTDWKWHNFKLSLNKGSFPGNFLNWKISFKKSELCCRG